MEYKRNIFQFAERRSVYIALAVLARIQLELGYVFFVNPLFAYAGFTLDFSLQKYVESWIIYIFAVSFAPRVLSKPSDYLMTTLVGGLLLPVLILYAYMDRSRYHLSIFLLVCVLVEIFRNGPVVRLPTVKDGQKLCVLLLLFMAIGVTGWYVASGGLQFFNLDFTRVYEFRDAASDVTDVGLMAYLNVWAAKVIGPALLAFFLWKRYFVFAACIILLHVIWFGVSSHKSVLFYPFLILFLWYWFKRTRALSLVYAGFFAVLSVVLGVYILYGDYLFASIFMRRAFFVNGDLLFRYYEFFSVNEHVYWSNSILSSVIDYPYHVNPALLIGEAWGTDAHANATFAANAYMHAGVWGAVFYGILSGLIFRIIDTVAAYGVPTWVAVSVIIIPAQALVLSADLPTSLLTHGVAFAILVLFLMRTSQQFHRQSLPFGDPECRTLK